MSAYCTCAQSLPSIVMAVVIVGNSIRILILIRTVPEIFSTETWANLTTQGSVAYHPLWAPLIIGDILINCGLLLVWFYVAYLFFTKSKHFPIWFICLADFYLLYVVVANFGIKQFLTSLPIFNLETAKRMMSAVIMAAIWVPYLLVSKRVKATFIK